MLPLLLYRSFRRYELKFCECQLVRGRFVNGETRGDRYRIDFFCRTVLYDRHLPMLGDPHSQKSRGGSSLRQDILFIDIFTVPIYILGVDVGSRI